MFVRFSLIAEGPGPFESVVGVRRSDGATEEIVLSKRLTDEGAINVGSPLMEKGGNFLVELPRESVSGKWRIWVPRSEAVQHAGLQAAE